MQYLGLTAFYERSNGFVNDRQVDIAVMSISFGYVYIVTIGYAMQYLGLTAFNDIAVMVISLRSVMACSTLVSQLLLNLAMVSLTIGRLRLRLWVNRYDRL